MRRFTAGWLLVACSCAGAAAQPTVEPPVTVPTSSSPPAAPEPLADRSPVEQPDSIVIVGRLRPDALSWVPAIHSPPLLPRAPLEVLVPSLAPALDGLVMADSPLEFVVAMRSLMAMGKGLRSAISVPLGSYEAAWTALRAQARSGRIEVSPHATGAVEILPVDDPTIRCWLMASSGTSPARLVVGSVDDDLQELAPYLARGLPVRALGDDPVAIEAWPREFAKAHGASLRTVSPLLARVLSTGSNPVSRSLAPILPELLAGMLDLSADVDRTRLSAKVDGAAMVVSITADIPSQSSWGAAAITSIASRPDTARDMFARLPGDSEIAWFSSGPEATRTDQARQVLTGWLRDVLGASARASTLDLIARTFVPRAPWVYAQGDASGEDATYARWTGRGLWQRTLSTFGWHVLGFDEPAKQLEPALDAGMQAYNSGDLRSLVYNELPSLCPGLGKIAKLKAPTALPAGSALYEMKLPASFFDDCMRHHGAQPPEPGPDESLVVVMVPDGNRTWIGFGPQGSPRRLKEVRDKQGGVKLSYGPQENRMVERMAGLLKPSGAGLSGAQGLSPLRAPGVKIGGFVSAGGLGGLVRFTTMREFPRWERARMARGPGHGMTRIPFTIELGSAGGTQLVMRIHLTQQGATELAGSIEETYLPSMLAP